MLFNSYPYLVFILVVAVGFRLTEQVGTRSGLRCFFLLAASYAFYTWWRADFLALLVGSTVANFALGRAITARVGRGQSGRLLVVLGLIFNLGLIAVFKYSGLFTRTVDDLFGLSFPIPSFFLPLAISFFTFEQISYLVDAGRGKAPVYSFLDYALFVAYFPHLIAGPIVRHNDLIPQFHRRRDYWERERDLSLGLTLFSMGLAKKTLIADSLAPYTDQIFTAAQQGTHLGLGDAWLGTLFFGFQIYFDFSAYTDMALGSSCLLGIRLPLNFNSPYKATSVIEFWRRWHISLSTFLRDYVYFSLGGNRRGEIRRYLNLMATMLIGGLWHGANWTFVVWGGLHGLFLAINHAFRELVARRNWHVPKGCSGAAHIGAVLLMFLSVTLAWIVFRAGDLAASALVYGGLIDLGNSHIVSFSPLAAFALVALFALVWVAPNSMEMTWLDEPALPPGTDTELARAGRLAWKPLRIQAVAYGALFSVSALALSNLSPFIYFQF